MAIDPNAPRYRVGKLKNGNVYVVCPFAPLLNAEWRRMMGKYQEITLKNADGATYQQHAWVLDGIHLESAKALLAEHIPPRSQLILRQYTFDSDDNHLDTAPSIDGIELLKFTRDSRGDIRAQDLFDIVSIVENTLRSGGSQRNPTLRGKLVIWARTRPNATASWSDRSHSAHVAFENITGQETTPAEAPTPTAPTPQYSDEDLATMREIAEERRCFVTVPGMTDEEVKDRIRATQHFHLTDALLAGYTLSPGMGTGPFLYGIWVDGVRRALHYQSWLEEVTDKQALVIVS